MESTGKPNDPLGKFALSVFGISGLLLRTGDRLTRSIGQSSAGWQVLVYQNNPANQHSLLLELTPHGADVLKTISSRNEEWTRHIMTRLNPEQLDALADALEEIAHIMAADEQQISQQETKKEERL